MAVFEHECLARACPIHFFPAPVPTISTATTGLKILFDHCQLTSSRLINVVFVDENQIGKTRSNGDQQYDIKSHASDGQTKYEAHCTIARVKDGDL